MLILISTIRSSDSLWIRHDASLYAIHTEIMSR